MHSFGLKESRSCVGLNWFGFVESHYVCVGTSVLLSQGLAASWK